MRDFHWAAISLTENDAGPHGSQGHDGPMRGLVPKSFQAAVRQPELIGNINTLASWATASIFLGSYLAN